MQIDSLNIPDLRKETPGVEHVIHFNNAGAALQPKPVIDAVTNYLNSEYSYGGYETADIYDRELSEFYYNVSSLIGGSPSEIAFAESATAAWDILFYSLNFQKGDRIITIPTEYASNYIAYLQVAKKTGAEILVIPTNEHDQPDLDFLEREVQNPKTKLISITHIPTNRGIVNPAEEIGEISSKAGVPYLLDACQSVGQYPVDVSKIKCDFLTSTGRKYLRGPRGTGFLYISSSYIDRIEPFTLDLHSAEWKSESKYEILRDAKKFEKWECNFAGKYGLSIAAKYVNDIGIDSVWKRIQYLSNHLRTELRKFHEIDVLDSGNHLSGIVSFKVRGKKSSDVKNELRSLGINVSVSIQSGTYLDMHPKGIDNAIRASVHYYNTEEEIESFIKTLKELKK